MRLTRRNGVLVAVVSMLAVDVGMALVGCSSDDRAPATGVTNNPPPTAGSDAAAGDAGDARATVGDGGDGGEGGDAGPPFVCLDDKPLAAFDGGTDCTANGCGAVCDDVRAHYKVGVVQVAVDCISKLPSCANNQALPCVDRALGRTCADPTSPAACAPLVKPCDPSGFAIDEFGCESFVNGLTDAGRTVFAGCILGKIDAGTCPDEVGACGDQIRQ